KFAHDAGRDVIKSCKIIRPNCSLPYVRLEDEDTGFLFYVPAVEFSTGSEAARLLAGALDKTTGEPVPANLFSWPLAQIEPYEPVLKELVFDVADKDVRFVGWRREGKDLVRVNRTTGPWKQTEYKENNGRKLRINYPKKLRYTGIGYIDNGLHYNIVNNNIEPAEAARRLRLIGQLLNSGKPGGDNKFWDDGAENHVLYCIEMLRIVNEPGVQVDGADIGRLTTQKAFWSEKNGILKEKIAELKKKIADPTDPGLIPELGERLKKYTGIKSYFEEEWVTMEGKTKAIMTQVIKQLFNAFLLDGKLQNAFGSKATYSFMSTITRGDLYIFGGCEYETLAKMVGTALKMDFQSCVLSRPANKHINQTRHLLFENDECQEFAVAGVGSAVGDERAMSLAGEALLINLLATQTLASLEAVLGKERARIYAGACGGIICYQVTDHDTAAEISKKIPEVVREERELSSNDLRLTNLFSADAKLKEHIKYVKEPRFSANDFMTLNIREWESIAYNKTMVGDHAKAHRQTNLPHPIGSAEGKRELEEFIRWYECASLEQLAWDQKCPELFSHLPQRQPAHMNEPAAPAHARSIVPAREIFVPAAIAVRPVTVGFKKASMDDLRASISEKTAGDLSTKAIGEAATSAPSRSEPLQISNLKSEISDFSAGRREVTRADLERYRALYENPGVLAEMARKLTADPGRDLETDYLEFLETKAAGADMNERTPIAGPQGMVTGNLRARTGPGLPAVDSLADEQRRIAQLRARMQEIEVMHSAAKPAPPLSAEVADAIASNDTTDPAGSENSPK
ncbi:MAG TPA: TraM recognition domain-containing protein, partial [Opitutaceae bacterium]|nr:TraM recognition domain-containing protein [Opitutaceae bacterium]